MQTNSAFSERKKERKYTILWLTNGKHWDIQNRNSWVIMTVKMIFFLIKSILRGKKRKNDFERKQAILTQTMTKVMKIKTQQCKKKKSC